MTSASSRRGARGRRVVSKLQGIPHYTHLNRRTPPRVAVPTLRQAALFLLRWTIVGLACASVVLLIRPGLLGNATTAASTNGAVPPGNSSEPQRSFADAVRRAGPAVVNIYTARVVDTAAGLELGGSAGKTPRRTKPD